MIKDQERLIVMDVTVHYEDRRSLANVYQEKISKYGATAEMIKQKLGCKSAEVMPIVVGSRGAMPTKTKEILKKLGFNTSVMITISMIALRFSIEMANAFIDYD